MQAMDWRSANFYLIRGENSYHPIDKQIASFKSFLSTYADHGLNTISLVWYTPVDPVTGAFKSQFTSPPWEMTVPDAGTLSLFTQAAHESGFKVIWKPQFLTDTGMPDNISPFSVGSGFDANAFLNNVRTFWHGMAPLAQQKAVDLLILGTEHQGFSVDAYENAWRSIIADVRSVYTGKLTYDEVSKVGRDFAVGADDVAFWDALDLIGVSMYVPLARNANATYADAYKTLFDNPTNIGDTGPGVNIPAVFAELAKTYGKPVFFTESGTMSRTGVLQFPVAPPTDTVNLQEQAIYYRVLMDAFANYDWFAGVNWWGEHNQFSAPPSSPEWRSYFDNALVKGFDFIGKPSGDVLKYYWKNGQPPPALVMEGTHNPDGTDNRDDRLYGGYQSDRMSGLAGNDVIHAGRGQDTLQGGTGNDTLHGEAGTDTAVFSGKRSDHTIVFDAPAGRYTVAGPDGTDSLISVERLRFDDGDAWIEDAAGLSGVVHRFFNNATGAHFFTVSNTEANAVRVGLPSFEDEGLAYRTAVAGATGTTDVYRFYNTATGFHFYTANPVERDAILKTLPTFQYEGVGYQAYGADSGPQEELYRFFNTATGAHLFTTSEQERDAIIATLPTFVFEGIAFYVDPL